MAYAGILDGKPDGSGTVDDVVYGFWKLWQTRFRNPHRQAPLAE